MAGLRATNETLLKQDLDAAKEADSNPTTQATPICATATATTVSVVSTASTAATASQMVATATGLDHPVVVPLLPAVSTAASTYVNPSLRTSDSKDSTTTTPPLSATSPALLPTAICTTAAVSHPTPSSSLAIVVTAKPTISSSSHVASTATVPPIATTAAQLGARLRKKSGTSLLNRSDSAEGSAVRSKYLQPSLSEPQQPFLGGRHDRDRSHSVSAATGSSLLYATGGPQSAAAAAAAAFLSTTGGGKPAKGRRPQPIGQSAGTSVERSMAVSTISKSSSAGHYIANELLNHHHHQYHAGAAGVGGIFHHHHQGPALTIATPTSGGKFGNRSNSIKTLLNRFILMKFIRFLKTIYLYY